ncbi:MAG: DUF2344 domain-containing protein [Clostridia bacterium]
MRTFQRVLRAQIPLAYSQGLTPSPSVLAIRALINRASGVYGDAA